MTDFNFDMDTFNQMVENHGVAEQTNQIAVTTNFSTYQQPPAFPDPQLPYYAEPPQLPSLGHQQTATTSMPQNTNNQDYIRSMMAEEGFWSWQVSMPLEDNTVVSGTHKHLFSNYPELRGDILEAYHATKASFNQPEQEFHCEKETTEPQSYESLFAELTNENQPEHFGEETTAQMTTDGADEQNLESATVIVPEQGKVNSETMLAPNQAESTVAGPLPAFKTLEPTSQGPSHSTAVATAAVNKAIAALQIPPTSDTRRRKAPATDKLPEPEATAPEYVEDINDPDDARWALAHPDPTNFTTLVIPCDDVEAVKKQIHFYAKQLFGALSTPGRHDLTGRIEKRRDNNQEFIDQVKTKFSEQQDTTMVKIRSLMRKPQQLKDARANCILAFEAAVFVNEVGVPSERYEQVKAKPNRTSGHYYHIDMKSICSKRLEKMVERVKEYKTIALDVLKGKDLKDFAQDPTYYANEKADFLISNVRRQYTNDAKKQAKKTNEDGEKQRDSEKKEPSGKRKRGAKPKQVVGDDGEDEPAVKRTR